jgi:hypothetical protein
MCSATPFSSKSCGYAAAAAAAGLYIRSVRTTEHNTDVQTAAAAKLPTPLLLLLLECSQDVFAAAGCCSICLDAMW